MKLNFACCVQIGVRETNDDRALMAGRIFDQESGSAELETPALAAVCDGCGGYAGGGIAAAAVLETLNQALPETLCDPAALRSGLDAAQEKLLAIKEQTPELYQMCTTVAGCLFAEDKTLIFHAGDSRVYRYDGFSLTRMTLDHSLVQELMGMGQMTEEEARTSPVRSVITRCLGVECLPPEIYVSHAPIAPGEIYLICSDGLWEYLEDIQIMAILATPDGNLEDTARRLVTLALEQESNDNITVCLCARPGTLSMPESTPFILD